MAADTPPPPAEAQPPSPPEDTTERSPSPPGEAEVEQDWATRFKYLLAEFENFRRRSAREHESTRSRARADIIGALLPVYEAAQRARDSVSSLPATDPIRRGIELVAREWQAFLDSQRVTSVARVGARFEADWHEAVGDAPTGPEAPEGTIVQVVQQGYRIGPALLRPAKVIVARSAPGSAAAEPVASGESEEPSLY